MSWSKKFITLEIYKSSKVPANPDANPPNVHILPTITSDATFQINSAKLYLSVVTLSINMKQGFKWTVFWSKFRSEIMNQVKSNNLDYMVDPAFKNINRLLVISFKNGDNDPVRNYVGKYYMRLGEIKDINALTENKPLFLIELWKTNKNRMKNLSKCQKMMILQQENY